MQMLKITICSCLKDVIFLVCGQLFSSSPLKILLAVACSKEDRERAFARRKYKGIVHGDLQNPTQTRPLTSYKGCAVMPLIHNPHSE
jgi:hypothetical protein